MRAAVFLGLLGVVGCTVPDVELDGRPCPCVEGWVCDATTDTCVRPGSAPDAGGTDAGGTDAGGTDTGVVADAGDIDAGPITTDAGGGDAGACFFRDDFEDGSLDGWLTPYGTWVETGGEAVQTDDTQARAFAFAEATEGSTDMRVRARFRQISGMSGGAIEISFGLNTASPLEQYFCNFEPNQADMVLMRSDAAGDALAIDEINLNHRSIPGYDAMASYTMVLEVRGTSFRCWVEEVPGTEMNVSDLGYGPGAVGLKTYAMAAAYDWIEVCPVD